MIDFESEIARLKDELARAYRERDASIVDSEAENKRLKHELAEEKLKCKLLSYQVVDNSDRD